MMLFALLALAAVTAQPPASASRLRALDQALLDAIAPGDKAPWDAALTPDAVYVDENGRILSRAEFLKALVPLPPGASGHIAITDYEADIDGDTALVRHRDDERELYHGQPLHARYLMTETWLRRAGAWKLAMVHAYVVAVDPPAMILPATALDAFVGDYALSDLTYTVRRQGDHLAGAQSGGAFQPLLAETPDVFFQPGHPRTRMIFQRDAEGAVARLIDRREGEDLVFLRKSR
jgi:ketosteroid isomerase-like protein